MSFFVTGVLGGRYVSVDDLSEFYAAAVQRLLNRGGSPAATTRVSSLSGTAVMPLRSCLLRVLACRCHIFAAC